MSTQQNDANGGTPLAEPTGSELPCEIRQMYVARCRMPNCMCGWLAICETREEAEAEFREAHGR